jgi:hypothetical protein
LVVLTLGLLLGILIVGLVAGFFVARTWTRLYVLVAIGLVAQIVVGAVLVFRAPRGDGWDGRSLVFGHWVPSEPLQSDVLALLPWSVGLAAGAFAWVVSRQASTRGRQTLG